MKLIPRVVQLSSGFLILLLATTPGVGQTPAEGQAPQVSAYAADTVVAVIDGQPLTLGDLVFRFASLSDRARRAYTNSDDGMARFLDDVVAGLVVVREAERLELRSSELGQRLLALRREDALRDLYARASLLGQLDETALRSRYEKQLDRFTVPLRVHVAHILVTVDRQGADSPEAAQEQALNRALALRMEITQGADFAEVARRASGDLTAAKGGDLGWVESGVLVTELEKAAFALEPGQVSKVVKSKLGYHVATVLGRREAGVLPFEMVRELILQEMIGEHRQELSRLANVRGKELLEQHQVEVFPDRLPW